MRRILTWGVGLYLGFAVVYFLFSLAAARFDTVRNLQLSVFKPAVGFNVGGGSFFNQDLVFNGTEVPRDRRFSQKTVEDISDFDSLVFLLEGFESATTNEAMINLGLDVAEIAQKSPGAIVRQQSVSFGLRLHPIPFYISQSSVVFMDISHTQKTFRDDCILTIVNNTALGTRDQEYRESCRRE